MRKYEDMLNDGTIDFNKENAASGLHVLTK